MPELPASVVDGIVRRVLAAKEWVISTVGAPAHEEEVQEEDDEEEEEVVLPLEAELNATVVALAARYGWPVELQALLNHLEVRVEADSSVSGTIVLAFPSNNGTNTTTGNTTAVTTNKVQVQLPFKFLFSPQEFHHFVVSNAPGATAHYAPAQQQGGNGNGTKAEEESSPAATAAVEQLPFSFEIVVTDRNYAIGTVRATVPTATTEGGGSVAVAERSFILRRWTAADKAEQEGASFRTIAITLAFLVIGGLVKFGPRMFLWYKGVDPKRFLHGPGENKQQQLSPQRRAELLQKQKEIIAKMKEEDKKGQAAAKRKK